MNISKIVSQTLYNMREVLGIVNCGIWKHDLMALLRKNKVLQENNIAFQKYIENGYFTTHYKKVPTKFSSLHTYPITLITEKGLNLIKELLEETIQEETEISTPTINNEIESAEMWVTEMTEINNYLYPINKLIKYDPLNEDKYPK